MSIVLGLVKARAPVFSAVYVAFSCPSSFLGPLSEVPTLVSMGTPVSCPFHYCGLGANC